MRPCSSRHPVRGLYVRAVSGRSCAAHGCRPVALIPYLAAAGTAAWAANLSTALNNPLVGPDGSLGACRILREPTSWKRREWPACSRDSAAAGALGTPVRTEQRRRPEVTDPGSVADQRPDWRENSRGALVFRFYWGQESVRSSCTYSLREMA